AGAAAPLELPRAQHRASVPSGLAACASPAAPFALPRQAALLRRHSLAVAAPAAAAAFEPASARPWRPSQPALAPVLAQGSLRVDAACDAALASPPQESLLSPAGIGTLRLRDICLQYPFSAVQAATARFDIRRKLGSGSAGTVYRGVMPDGSDVAVKEIDLAALGVDAIAAGFEEEVAILSKFRHPNLVVLMGWACEGSRRFLIYEYLNGGDVQQRLRRCKESPDSAPFSWRERLSAALDAATGLAHIHNARPHAFHRDVKSANILLGDGRAKVADFGLSCVARGRKDNDLLCRFTSGTPGYSCPTYISTGKVTEGSEVFSFGMVLLELLLNLMPAGRVQGNLVYPIRDAVQPDAPGALQRCMGALDPSAGWPYAVSAELASLALACVHPDDARRPLFNEVCRSLRSIQDRPAWAPPAGAAPCPTTPCPAAEQASSPSASVAGQHACAPVAAERPSTASSSEPPACAGPCVPAADSGAVASAAEAAAEGDLEGRPELTLELTHACPSAPAASPRRARALRLRPGALGGGRFAVELGRHCEAVGEWLEEVLPDPTSRRNVSRRACEVSWCAVPPAAGVAAEGAAVWLTAVGAGLLAVDGTVVHRGASAELRQGSQLQFLFQRPNGELGVTVAVALSWRWRRSAERPPPPEASGDSRGSSTSQPPPPPVAGAAGGAAQGSSRWGAWPSAAPGAREPPARLSTPRAGTADADGPLDEGTPRQPTPRLGPALGEPEAPAQARRARFLDASPAAWAPQAPWQAARPRSPSLPRACPSGGLAGAACGDEWALSCAFAAGLAREEALALHPSQRVLGLTLPLGGSGSVVGRQHQLSLFEALLAGRRTLLSLVSRSHVRLDRATEHSVRATNLSQNVLLVNEAVVLGCGEAAELQ
ncbi:unnamed protein product, partial [Prorocentrum cordatum]